MRRRRSSRRRNSSRKDIQFGNNIIILIIIVLIFINIGSLAIRFFKGPINNTSKYSLLDNLSSFPVIRLFMGDKDISSATEPNDERSDYDLDDEQESHSHVDDIIIDRLEEYESLILIKDSHGTNPIENIPAPLNIEKVKLDREKNYILMYHTHGTESFLVEDEDLYHNEDKNKNIVSIGRTLSTVLRANGHKVDHVETLHDLPSYNKSYSRSLNTVNQKKEEEQNLKIFLDIHRDGVEKDASYRESFLKTARINIDGTSVATFSLVIGPATPNYDQVLSFAKYIKAVSDTLYPGLCKGIIIKPYGKFNLYASDYSALIEMGSNLVTLEEANEGAKLVGEILSIVLDSIIE